MIEETIIVIFSVQGYCGALPTLSITIFRIKTLSIMTCSIKINKTQHSAKRHSADWQSIAMLGVVYTD